MKRIKSILLAIAMLLAAPAFFTSCQEDAPEINYTMNVSVINDFTKVVEAINNGFLKNEEAIKKLTETIDKMNTDQKTKLQAIIDVLTSVNATLETKLTTIEAAMKAQTLTLESKLTLLETAIKNQTLKQEEMADKLITAINNLQGSMEAKIEAITEAINNVNTTLQSKLALIEAAIKAQTLSLEAKLDLIEAAIKALPDYSSQLAAIKTAIENLPDYGDKLAAIEAAIKAMPNYSDKFDAVTTALNAMKAQIEALGTGQASIVEAINNTTAAINALIAAVNSDNTSAAAALAQIIQKLEELKNKIGGGGSTPAAEYVDLGLPSGLKWAKCNLGATKPEEFGNYYAWGETEPKTEYTWDNYKWGTKDNQTKYNATDGKTVLDPEDDAATVKLGSPWRMPTIDEIQELINNCTWTWTTKDGINGYEVKGKNGNAIFLPGAGGKGPDISTTSKWGRYWSSSLYAKRSNDSNYFFFASDEYTLGLIDRHYGFTIRPVRP
ncbi:hypothetical protein HMPREF9332_00615 [Alloprevotella rava F0323]|uniref:Fibrobacter succinogenes major paralogous domain-containing protein n=1 Tax=Alloprevotella rava F0323 TaxID=679199 RepID=G5GAR8_9BACT|nr:hypothetical protein [Alloprevotella rava]EHG23599.1 hypothetical protein HMPREF9332_00615 [Alloprevotella rava F0323]